MTVKLTVVYGKPDEPDAWDKHYRDVHVPIVERFPGLQRAEFARVLGAPGGGDSPYHLVAEMYFADPAALNAAFASPAGAESAKDFAQTAPKGTFMAVCEVE